MADVNPANGDKGGQRRQQKVLRLPLVYRLFFLVLEPISALVGAYYTYFRQPEYLSLLHVDSWPVPPETPSPAVSMAMNQLANMYLFFAINEAVVLRSTKDMRVWRAVLSVLLLADLGHLWTMADRGNAVYYDVASWNAGDWGNVPWVYAGATLRICFLLGIGMSP